MGTTGVTAGGSNSQNQMISNENTRRGHFSHFRIVRANPFEDLRLLEKAIIIHLQETTIIIIYHHYHY